MSILDSIGNAFSSAYDGATEFFSPDGADNNGAGANAKVDLGNDDAPVFKGNGPLLEYSNTAPWAPGGGHGSGAGASSTWTPSSLSGGGRFDGGGASASWSLGGDVRSHGATGSWEPSTETATGKPESAGGFGGGFSFDFKWPSLNAFSAGAHSAFDGLGRVADRLYTIGSGIVDHPIDSLRGAATGARNLAAHVITTDARLGREWLAEGLRTGGDLVHGVATGDLRPYAQDWSRHVSDELGFFSWAGNTLADGFKSNFLTDNNRDGHVADEFTESSANTALGLFGAWGATKLIPAAYSNVITPSLKAYDDFHAGVGTKITDGMEALTKGPNEVVLNVLKDVNRNQLEPLAQRFQQKLWQPTRSAFDDWMRLEQENDSFVWHGYQAAGKVTDAVGKGADWVRGVADRGAKNETWGKVFETGYKWGSDAYGWASTGMKRAKMLAPIGIGAGVVTGNINVYFDNDPVLKKFNVYPSTDPFDPDAAAWKANLFEGHNATLEFPATGTQLSWYGNGAVLRPPWPMENAGMPSGKIKPPEKGGSAGVNISARASPFSTGVGVQWFNVGGYSLRTWANLGVGQVQAAVEPMLGLRDFKVEPGAMLEVNPIRGQIGTGFFSDDSQLALLERTSMTTTVGRMSRGQPEDDHWYVSPGKWFRWGTGGSGRWPSGVGTLNPDYPPVDPGKPDYKLGDLYDSIGNAFRSEPRVSGTTTPAIDATGMQKGLFPGLEEAGWNAWLKKQ